MSFGLRGKFLIGFGGLLAILLIFVGASYFWLSRLGSSIDTILRENYRSVVAAQEMKESLERIDSTALATLTVFGEPADGMTEIYRENFEEAFSKAFSNVTLTEEGQTLKRINELYREYRITLAIIVDESHPLEERQELYSSRLLPLFDQIKQLANRILQMNQENMVVASVRAHELAVRSQQQLFGIAIVGILIGIGCVFFLSRTTLVPIRRLTESTREIEKGEFPDTFESHQKDEIGELTRAFNNMSTKLREYKRVDQARLLRAQEISRLTIDSLPDAVFLLSPEKQVELSNRTAERIFDIRPGKVPPEAELEWLAPLLSEAVQTRSAKRFYGEIVQRFTQGEEQFYLPTAVTIHDEDFELVGITVILSDVTQVRRIDEMKNDMLATVSHELLTPITSLELGLNILREERYGTLTPKQREMVENAGQDAERLQRMIDDLLDVARLKSGKIELDISNVAVRALVDESIGSLKASYEEKEVALEVRIGPEVDTVLADLSRTPLILTNLLSNALKNTSPEGQVQVDIIRAGDRTRFSVSDSGRGIPASDLQSVFERFHQTPGSEKGVGLGLAITEELVRAHGGVIECHSREGVGSSFSFELAS